MIENIKKKPKSKEECFALLEKSKHSFYLTKWGLIVKRSEELFWFLEEIGFVENFRYGIEKISIEILEWKGEDSFVRVYVCPEPYSFYENLIKTLEKQLEDEPSVYEFHKKLISLYWSEVEKLILLHWGETSN